MTRSLLRLGVFLVLAAGLGLANGQFGWWRAWGYARAERSDQAKPLTFVADTDQVRREQEEHQRWVAQTAIGEMDFIRHCEAAGLVIDARPAEEFAEGHLDALVLMNVPAESASEHFERVASFLGQPVVLYCASDACDSAETLWRLMQAWGFGPEVRIFHPGWEGIVEAGLPTATGPDRFAPGSDGVTDISSDQDSEEAAAEPTDLDAETDAQPPDAAPDAAPEDDDGE